MIDLETRQDAAPVCWCDWDQMGTGGFVIAVVPPNSPADCPITVSYHGHSHLLTQPPNANECKPTPPHTGSTGDLLTYAYLPHPSTGDTSGVRHALPPVVTILTGPQTWDSIIGLHETSSSPCVSSPTFPRHCGSEPDGNGLTLDSP